VSGGGLRVIGRWMRPTSRRSAQWLPTQFALVTRPEQISKWSRELIRTSLVAISTISLVKFHRCAIMNQPRHRRRTLSDVDRA
jgi:hypothetical protein